MSANAARDTLMSDDRVSQLREESKDWPSWALTGRQICDLELILNGGFAPLSTFLSQKDYESVRDDMRLSDGTLWPMPITLDVSEALAEQLEPGKSSLALRDAEGFMLAVLHVQEKWTPDRELEAERVFGTKNTEHPGVNHLLNNTNPVYVSGQLEGVHLPIHYDYRHLRLSPAETKERFRMHGWKQVVAFQTRNPMHRAHQELTLRAAKSIGGGLLIHPVVGMTKPGDVDHYTRVRCYQALLETYPTETVELALLPLAMRMGGPREAVWHAIIRKNYGCTHLIVGRDHAGPGSDSKGNPFYGPYDAQELLKKHAEEIGIEMVPFRLMVYVKDDEAYEPIDEVPEGKETLSISGTQLRSMLTSGEEIPSWFTFPKVAAELRRSYKPRHEQGFTVFFTGLSGSGKSTVANGLRVKLLEKGGRFVTLLDGDLVRQNLSSELGFSKEHRNLNIQRIGFVANEATKNGGIAICAPIAPYDKVRREVRELVSSGGGFVLVHVSTPLETCEKRDRKGLYAKARAGIIKEFTGISDPYEEPADAELSIDTTDTDPEECVQQVLTYLYKEGYLQP